jgi:hypothetical protein
MLIFNLTPIIGSEETSGEGRETKLFGLIKRKIFPL